jgi:hypothetical protein
MADVDPVVVVGSGRFGLQVLGVSLGLGDLGGGAVAEPGVGSVVLGVDVCGDLSPWLVEGFPFSAPGAALLELAEPGLDERL